MTRVIIILSIILVLFSCKSDNKEIKYFRIEITQWNGMFYGDNKYIITQDSIFVTHTFFDDETNGDTIRLNKETENIDLNERVYSFKKALNSKEKVKIIERLNNIDFNKFKENYVAGGVDDLPEIDFKIEINEITMGFKIEGVRFDDILALTNEINALIPKYKIFYNEEYLSYFK